MVHPNTDPIIQAVNAQEWHMYAIPQAEDEVDRAQKMAAAGPATEIVPEVPYMFSPNTDTESLANVYNLSFHGPALNIEDLSDREKYVGGSLCYDRRLALFSRFMLTESGIALCSPRSAEEEGLIKTDKVILAPRTAVETFANDFTILPISQVWDLVVDRADYTSQIS